MRERSKKTAKRKARKSARPDPAAQALRRVCSAPLNPQARPIWEELLEIGASVPPEEWDKVPTDAARNLDHYLYGHAKKP